MMDDQRMRQAGHSVNAVACLGLVIALTGCNQPDVILLEQVRHGDYGQARARLGPNLVQDPGQRQYTIDRMRLGVVELADGLPNSAETTFNEVYEILRIQGLNADRTVESVVINEGIKRWKGEPFEQALMYCYIGIQKAMRGEWDNARAVVSNAMFMLKDFSQHEEQRESRRRLTSSHFYSGVLNQSVTELRSHPSVRMTRITNAESTVLVLESEGHQAGFRMPATQVDPGVPTAEFFKDLRARCDVRLVGDDVIDGQEAWIILATSCNQPTPGHQPHASSHAGLLGWGAQSKQSDQAAVSMLYYFSKESGLLLQQVVSLPDGHVVASQAFSNHRVDLEIAPETFEPPEGVPIYDVPQDSSAGPSGNPLMP